MGYVENVGIQFHSLQRRVFGRNARYGQETNLVRSDRRRPTSTYSAQNQRKHRRVSCGGVVVTDLRYHRSPRRGNAHVRVEVAGTHQHR